MVFLFFKLLFYSCLICFVNNGFMLQRQKKENLIPSVNKIKAVYSVQVNYTNHKKRVLIIFSKGGIFYPPPRQKITPLEFYTGNLIIFKLKTITMTITGVWAGVGEMKTNHSFIKSWSLVSNNFHLIPPEYFHWKILWKSTKAKKKSAKSASPQVYHWIPSLKRNAIYSFLKTRTK